MLEEPAVALPLPGRHPDEECADLREISTSGVWTASSSLPNHGIDNINDRDLETYWQSCGPQPHTIDVKFAKRKRVLKVSVYMNFPQDESYTACRLSVRGGPSEYDVQELTYVDLPQITGWTHISLEDPPGSGHAPALLALQFAILTNHLGGKDTQMRQMRLYSAKSVDIQGEEDIEFQHENFLPFLILR
ncbi:anaphase-promoting complex subunit 10 [Entomortierella parvispora]|uniref:Anaphase-promoting complex subunit 10 n=1 Tax=Entomortierella parvispora TaxID=205924 RepID=A0A9P3H9K0_9FUNG|nr:anaphase-promoting complex subunit 10 [Entomortierella parvispora]